MGYKKSPQQCCGLFLCLLIILANIFLLRYSGNREMMMVMMDGINL